MNQTTLDQEKEKLNFEHKLEIRRILIEKFLIAVILLIAAFLANMLVEKYKNNLIEKRFLLEKRLVAIDKLRGIYSELNIYFFRNAKMNDMTDKDWSDYNLKVLEFGNYFNKVSVLFDERHEVRVQGHLLIHEAVSYKKKIAEDEYKFGLAVFEDFEILTRGLLWSETISGSGSSDRSEFKFVEDSVVSAPDFFEKNFSAWKKSN